MGSLMNAEVFGITKAVELVLLCIKGHHVFVSILCSVEHTEFGSSFHALSGFSRKVSLLGVHGIFMNESNMKTRTGSGI